MLRQSTLSDRVREVAVLRAVHHRGCAYLWHHHIPIAHRAGLTDSEIESLRTGSPTDATDRLVVRAVDELRSRDTLTDDTWQVLSETFDERQRMDLVFTIGCYDLLATAVNAFDIEPG